jgi:predicted RNase H-like nuclease
MTVYPNMEIFIGFDSAWAGTAKAPGAITAVTFSGGAR